VNIFDSLILCLVMRCLTLILLAAWWERFGDEVPTLQKFAVRILSLTTSASGCERNWSTFEQVRKVKTYKATTYKFLYNK